MTWLSAIIMGLVQGIAEFLPISSSGHLAIAEHLLNMQGASEIPQFYDVLLHLGLGTMISHPGSISFAPPDSKRDTVPFI